MRELFVKLRKLSADERGAADAAPSCAAVNTAANAANAGGGIVAFNGLPTVGTAFVVGSQAGVSGNAEADVTTSIPRSVSHASLR